MFEAKEFTKCPYCGSTERAAESVMEELRKEGKVKNPNLRTCATFFSVGIADPALIAQQLMVWTLSTMVDVCLGCGALYAVRVEPIQRANEDANFGRNLTLMGKAGRP